MALTELAAFETAYQALAPLDEPARRRALQWLSDALGDTKPLAGRAGEASGAASANSNSSSSSKPATRRRRAPATTAAARTRKRKAAANASTGREYRRMPDPDEVMSAYREVGTVSGLAEHFDVPQ